MSSERRDSLVSEAQYDFEPKTGTTIHHACRLGGTHHICTCIEASAKEEISSLYSLLFEWLDAFWEPLPDATHLIERTEDAIFMDEAASEAWRTRKEPKA